MAYAIIDADGAFDSAGRGKSYVYAVYDDRDQAIRAARRMRQVQIIVGALEKDEIVYQDAVGRIFPSAWRKGD